VSLIVSLPNIIEKNITECNLGLDFSVEMGYSKLYYGGFDGY
jgi:hypothetical protein